MNQRADIKAVQRQLGAEIRTLRQERRISFLCLAARAGISKANLSKIENGLGNPTMETMVRVARALGVHFSVFLEKQRVQTLKQLSAHGH